MNGNCRQFGELLGCYMVVLLHGAKYLEKNKKDQPSRSVCCNKQKARFGRGRQSRSRKISAEGFGLKSPTRLQPVKHFTTKHQHHFISQVQMSTKCLADWHLALHAVGLICSALKNVPAVSRLHTISSSLV